MTTAVGLLLLCGANFQALAQPNMEQVRALVNKGNALMRAYHFPEALAAYEDALKVDPGNAVAKSNILEAYNNWGIYYFKQKKYKEARAEWQKVLEINPNHANAKRNLSIMSTVLQQQGINLDEPQQSTDALNGSEQPAKAKESKSAATVPAESPATPGGKADVPKADPLAPDAGAIILTPGVQLRQPQPTATFTPVPSAASSSVAPAVTPIPMERPVVPPAAAEPSQAPAGPPSTTSGASLWQSRSVNPLYPTTPDQFKSIFAKPESAKPVAAPPVSTTPAISPLFSTTPNVTPPAESAAGGSSLEDQLGAVETKVYGQKQGGLTVMQRLEKIERDTSGTTRSGTIIERINNVKQQFGL